MTLEPRDLLGVEESAGGSPAIRGGGALGGGGGALGALAKDGREGVKPVEVELRRRPGEGFGFVIASQEVTNGGESRFVSVTQAPPQLRVRFRFRASLTLFLRDSITANRFNSTSDGNRDSEVCFPEPSHVTSRFLMDFMTQNKQRDVK